MPDLVVEVEGLWKRFGEVTAVEDLSFEVERGQVYGVLGPNGAGKSTTLRMLMGLQQPTKGSARLFGEPVSAGCHQLTRVGVIIEQACFVPHLTGMRNLRLFWEAGGGRMSDADLETALSIADLGSAIDRKVKTYSQGMQQRLGFARALLNRPELLVLDEPTNGLDPGEIREIRELIGRLAGTGATVLFSSHHLSEVEQVCSHVVVMNHGRLVTHGTVRDLIGTAKSVFVQVDDLERGRDVLTALPTVEGVVVQTDGLVVELRSGGRAPLTAALVAAGLQVETVMATQRLEDAFLDLLAVNETGTGASTADATAVPA
jgi:ABC-2 type transport system ATP-binding protein